MNKKISAGLLMYRLNDITLEVFLVHPGGPYYTRKDSGAWSIPKGEIEGQEDLLGTAIREFAEETRITPTGNFLALGSVKQKGGKIVFAWAFKVDYQQTPAIKSNKFELEWPPRSGKMQKFPEIDRAEFFPIETAKIKINNAQFAFIERLESNLG